MVGEETKQPWRHIETFLLTSLGCQLFTLDLFGPLVLFGPTIKRD